MRFPRVGSVQVDSILIDEARTPLIISGQAEKPSEKYIKSGKLASALARDVHYTVDEKQRNVLLTEDGYACIPPMYCVSARMQHDVLIGAQLWSRATSGLPQLGQGIGLRVGGRCCLDVATSAECARGPRVRVCPGAVIPHSGLHTCMRAGLAAVAHALRDRCELDAAQPPRSPSHTQCQPLPL